MSAYNRKIKVHSRMPSIFFWATFLLVISCGQVAQEKSELAHIGDPYEVPNSWNICNFEPFDLYLTLAHVDYSNRYWPVGQDPYTGQTIEAASSEIHGWTLLPHGACTDVGPIWKAGVIVLRSSQGVYEASGGSLAQAGSAVCVNSSLTSNKTVPWSAIVNGYDYMKPYLSCPSGTVPKEKFIYSDLPNRQCANDPKRIDCKFTLNGGSIHSDGDYFILEDNTDSKKLDEKIKDVKAKLAGAEKELDQCKGRVSSITSKKILELNPQAFAELARVCGESDTIKELKDEVDRIQKEIRDFILAVSQSLDDIYRTVLAVAGKLGVTLPLDDDYKAAAVEEIVHPSPSLDPNSSGFYLGLFDKYQVIFDASYTTDKRRFLTSVLGLTYTFPVFGRSLASEDPLSQETFVDFKSATDKVEDYFSKVDFNLDEYGYPLDSPVPDDIKKTIRDDIKPNAPAQAMALDDELKKWEGTLTEKQRLALEAVRFLGTAFHQTLLKLPEEASAVHNRLKSIADGAIEAVKDVTKCLAKVGASGEFADWYEITVGRDYCDGSELTFAGRVATAAGLVIGSGKIWRVLAEAAGVVTTKVGRIAGFVADTLESGRRKIPDLKENEVKEVLRDLDLSYGCTLLSSTHQTSRTNAIDLIFGVSIAFADTSEEECFRQIFTEIVNNAGQYWSLSGYKHVLRGELYDVAGATKLAGGLHTQKGLNEFIFRNKKHGLSYDIVEVSTFSERNLDPNKLLVRRLPNGVREVQFPREAFINSDAAQISLPTSDGRRIRHIKTLWPESFTPEDIATAAKEAIMKAGPNPPGVLQGVYKGIPFTLYYKDGKIRSIFAKFSES